jgi:uncharacterized peroxidase-related enzyme
MSDFTTAPVDWAPWVPVPDAATASPEQLALLQAHTHNGVISTYNATMAHDPSTFAHRSALLGAIMNAPGGLSRAERELVSVVVSVLNHCVYCASIHGRLFLQHGGDAELLDQLFAHGVNIPLSERQRELVDYTTKLTLTPDQIGPADQARMRAVGFTDGEIIDVIHVAALFAWYNRLLETLGEAIVLE